MAATALNLLTAALPSAELPTDATATGLTGQTVAAGLFESLLASAATQATVSAVAVQIETQSVTLTGATDSGNTDQLTRLLGLLEQAAGDNTTTDGATGVNPDLLARLLAALGVNAQQLATQQTAATGTTGGTQVTAVNTQTTTLTVALTTNTAPVNLLPTPTTTAPTTATATATPTPALLPPNSSLTAPTSVPLPTDQPTTATTASPPTISVSDANRVAGRDPAVVLQTPVSNDPGLRPPTGLVPVGPDAIQPPVSEASAVKGLPPVSSSGGATVGNAAEEPTTAARPTLPTASTVSFQVSTTPTTRTPNQPDATPAVVTATTPSTTAANPLPAPTQAGAPVPTVRVTPAGSTAEPAPASQPPAAPQVAAATQSPPVVATRPTTPEIAVTVAQPVDVTGTRIDANGLTGISAFPTAAPVKDSNKTDGETVAPFGTTGPTATTTTPNPADETPAPARVTAPPVADQLAGPIAAHVQTRTVAGETELRIRLDPPELGEVKLKIVSTGGDVRAELHVSSEAVRRVVESQLPELRQKLDAAGVTVQRFNVTADTGGGTARDDRGERWRPPVELPPSGPPAVRPRRASVLPSATGRVDVSV